MYIENVGDMPHDHEPEQLCPVCGQPLWGELAFWLVGDGMIEVGHSDCLREAQEEAA